MRKLKYILPLVPITLTVVLFRWSSDWRMAALGPCDAPGADPGMSLVLAINAPAVPLVGICGWLYPNGPATGPILLGVELVLLALFWFWAVATVESWKTRRAVLMFRLQSLRIIGDLVLIVVGGTCGFFAFGEFRIKEPSWESVGCYAWLPMAGWMNFAADALLLAWCIALTFFFGRDLALSVRRRDPALG